MLTKAEAGTVKMFIFTLRNFKFSSYKICWSNGIKFTLAESFVKLILLNEFDAGAPTNFVR